MLQMYRYSSFEVCQQTSVVLRCFFIARADRLVNRAVFWERPVPRGQSSTLSFLYNRNSLGDIFLVLNSAVEFGLFSPFGLARVCWEPGCAQCLRSAERARDGTAPSARSAGRERRGTHVAFSGTADGTPGGALLPYRSGDQDGTVYPE